MVIALLLQYDSVLAETMQSCASSVQKINRVTRPLTKIVLRYSPSYSGTKITAQGAIEGSGEYTNIDESYVVREVCRNKDWSFVVVIQPEWFINLHRGWVPSKELRQSNEDFESNKKRPQK
jgi:hypothetical protein